MSRPIGYKLPTFDHPCGACGVAIVHSSRAKGICPACKKQRMLEADRRCYERNKRRKCDMLKEWRKANPDKVLEQKIKYASNKPWLRLRAGKMSANPDFNRDSHYKQEYGITLAQFNAILGKQGGKCHLCLKDVTAKKSDAHLDHCHHTGKVRAILCRSCNTGIGMLKDSAELLRRAAEYLDEHNGHS